MTVSRNYVYFTWVIWLYRLVYISFLVLITSIYSISLFLFHPLFLLVSHQLSSKRNIFVITNIISTISQKYLTKWENQDRRKVTINVVPIVSFQLYCQKKKKKFSSIRQIDVARYKWYVSNDCKRNLYTFQSRSVFTFILLSKESNRFYRKKKKKKRPLIIQRERFSDRRVQRREEEKSRSIDNFDEYSSIVACSISLVAVINYAIRLDYIDGSRDIERME